MRKQNLRPADKEPTNREILEVINDFSTATDRRFDKVESRFDKVESRLGKIESNMLTKDYLDEKLSDLRGDLVVLTRKEDNKVKKLIDILRKHNLISSKEVEEVMSMEPFARLSV